MIFSNEFESDLLRTIESKVQTALENYIQGLNARENDRLLTLSEAAEFLRISKPTLRNIPEEQLPARSIGEKICYRQSDLDRYIDGVY